MATGSGKKVGIYGTSHARTRGRRRNRMHGRPLKINADIHRKGILRALNNLWPLERIARRLRIHPHTLSRFIRNDEELFRQYDDSLRARACEKIINSEYKGTWREHPLRTIFLCEKLHWLSLPHARHRSHYRDGLYKCPDILKPFGGMRRCHKEEVSI